MTAAAAAGALLVGGLVFSACDGGSADDGDGASPDARRASEAAAPKQQARGWNPRPDSIAAVGDSITRGFDACSVLSDCPEVSWATGTDPVTKSLAGRLLDKPAGNSWNLAETGALTSDLPAQMKRAAAHEPELVTVMTGANDACRPTVGEMTPVDDFRADLERGMRTLREEQPRAQVYMVSVPDLKRLWSQGRKNPVGTQVWKLGICQSMLRDPDAMDKAAVQRREQVYDRVVAYNSVLEDVCSKDRRCRYDGGAVFEYRFTGDELSEWDWFHPSKQGQRTLAQLAYRRITAP
ncbi:SGNH/GDSL hydrolase family protein [Streptomyces armeniacus]|uniref:SGNH/GDSL hydrolase family protein n=2 Tax=Streptomyces armeniacus TaxID=83291 RepID=A0A345Y0L7_9ACTN|nr:SGNH/GDSL hydrolase family protein [Streptomyces armeniacus]AXK37433.1 SGNH/GDSL hydrolase family protein [Streptomyces armeniacus]